MSNCIYLHITLLKVEAETELISIGAETTDKGYYIRRPSKQQNEVIDRLLGEGKILLDVSDDAGNSPLTFYRDISFQHPDAYEVETSVRINTEDFEKLKSYLK